MQIISHDVVSEISEKKEGDCVAYKEVCMHGPTPVCACMAFGRGVLPIKV